MGVTFTCFLLTVICRMPIEEATPAALTSTKVFFAGLTKVIVRDPLIVHGRDFHMFLADGDLPHADRGGDAGSVDLDKGLFRRIDEGHRSRSVDRAWA